MVQYPWIKMQTMVVFVGSQGCGKNSVISPYLDIFGTNGIILDDTKHLVGSFNSLTRDRVMIFLDELHTQPKTLSLVKSAITNTKRTFEGKYKDAGIAEDFSHYIAATDSPDNLTFQEKNRRYFLVNANQLTFPTPEEKASYFSAFYAHVVANDGLMSYALMCYLYARDLSGFNVASDPPTSLFYAQMLQKDVDSVCKWWKVCLERGYHCPLEETIDQNLLRLTNFERRRGRVHESTQGKIYEKLYDIQNLPYDCNRWIEEIAQEDLFKMYEKWCYEEGVIPLNKSKFCKKLVWYVNVITEKKHRIRNEKPEGSLRNYYQIRSLNECIQYFNSRVDSSLAVRRDPLLDTSSLLIIEDEVLSQ